MPDPLGLIAGEGIFPLLVARGARAAGKRVVCVGLRGSAWPDVEKECDEFHWVGVTRLGQWIRKLRAAGVREAIMVGRVTKTRMYRRAALLQYIPDVRTARLFVSRIRHDKRPGAILNAIADELAKEGITLIDSTIYTPDQLTTAGVLTKRQPTEKQMADAQFGWELCQKLSRLDIGQAIAVLDKDVIAVEAIEGTNNMIDRAGTLCKTGGWTLIKVANSQQDMRMDVPTIGITTIEKLAAAKAACVVLEVGKTVLLEKQKVLELADRYKIAIVGMTNDSGRMTNDQTRMTNE
ncbi:MAG TPA: UDP-2,3-diacylglucosamine diphosphatase LpxI, partial [Tepidisphaeraceae bacterium]|nr:UDP-2,3-diacylglucosamine diphosphatase LpxI [Tepidisphaeraceae bacterium]